MTPYLYERLNKCILTRAVVQQQFIILFPPSVPLYKLYTYSMIGIDRIYLILLQFAGHSSYLKTQQNDRVNLRSCTIMI